MMETEVPTPVPTIIALDETVDLFVFFGNILTCAFGCRALSCYSTLEYVLCIVEGPICYRNMTAIAGVRPH